MKSAQILAVALATLPAIAGAQDADMHTIHQLMADNKAIRRTVKTVPGGIEATTDATDPKVVARIQEHVAAMRARLEKKQPIRTWDPLFAVLFEHADKIRMRVVNTKTGVRIVETSADPYVVKIIQSHARAVTGFVKDGTSGMPQRHPAPARP